MQEWKHEQQIFKFFAYNVRRLAPLHHTVPRDSHRCRRHVKPGWSMYTLALRIEDVRLGQSDR